MFIEPLCMGYIDNKLTPSMQTSARPLTVLCMSWSYNFIIATFESLTVCYGNVQITRQSDRIDNFIASLVWLHG